MKKKWIILGVIVVIFALVAVALYLRPEPDPWDQYQFETLSYQDLTQAVTVSGMIVPASEVTLAFESGGRIGFLVGEVGKHVSAGSVIASLISTDLTSDVVQAQAAVKSAQATLVQQEAALEAQQVKLEELEKGVRPEELKIKETELAIAYNALDELQSTKSNLLMQAQLQASDAVNRLTDDFFLNDQTNVPHFRFHTTSSVSANVLEGKRVQVRDVLKDFSLTNTTLAKTQLGEIKTFLTLLSTAFDQANSYDDGSPLSSTVQDANKTSLKTALGNVQNEIDTLADRENALTAQQLVVDRIAQELVLKNAPPTDEQIAAQKAAIKQAEAMVLVQKANIAQAEANVQSIQVQFSKKRIMAPFSGVISKQDAHVGEIVGASTPVVSLISDVAFQIEAFIPEVDVGLIHIGQTSEVKIDAYPSDLFFAKVIQLDPVETKIEGVSTYRVVLEFDAFDGRLKSGMTVDLEIVTATRTDVLTIPARALINRDNQTYVRVKVGEELVEQEVVVGIRADGRVEILSGLSEGDRVVVRETL